MATAWFDFDGVEYEVSGPDRRIGPDGDQITIRRGDNRPLPWAEMRPGMVQLRDDDSMPAGLEEAAREALAVEQERYEAMSYEEYHYGRR